MTLQECYAALGGDYADVMARLRSERLVQKFVLKFADDPSYALLRQSLADGNGDEAFRAAHTIKGMCANLGFSALLASDSELTEILRAGQTPDETLLARVEADYTRTVDAVRAFAAAQAQ